LFQSSQTIDLIKLCQGSLNPGVSAEKFITRRMEEKEASDLRKSGGNFAFDISSCALASVFNLTRQEACWNNVGTFIG
jgi:hypothetical protein